MNLEPNSDPWGRGGDRERGLRHGRRRRGIPIAVTRFHASALHTLDPIEGWVPVDGALDALSPSAWREARLTHEEPCDG